MKKLLLLTLVLCLVALAVAPAHAMPTYDPYNQDTVTCMAGCGSSSATCLHQTGNYGACHVQYLACAYVNCGYSSGM